MMERKVVYQPGNSVRVVRGGTQRRPMFYVEVWMPDHAVWATDMAHPDRRMCERVAEAKSK
jgi:hypothetical protein